MKGARRERSGHCPDCGTAPARDACGWPCGRLGLVPPSSLEQLPTRNVARETFFRRRGGSLWWGSGRER